MALALDAVGVGDGEFWPYSQANFLYWQHNAAAGACVLAAVTAYGGPTFSGTATDFPPMFKAKYEYKTPSGDIQTTLMVSLGWVYLGNNPANGMVELFEIADVPGPGIICVDVNNAVIQPYVNYYMAGTSVSYTGAAPLGADNFLGILYNNTGTSSLSQPVTCAPGERIVQAFANQGLATMSSFGGGSLQSHATVATSPHCYGYPLTVYTSVALSDTPTSATFSAATAGATPDGLGGISVRLAPAQPNAAYLTGHGQLSATLGAPMAEHLTDAFNFADTTKWTFYGNATVSGGQLQLVPTPASSGGSYIVSNQRWSLVNSPFGGQLVTPPNTGNGGTRTYLCMTEDLTFQNCLRVYWNNGTLYYTQTVGGVTTAPWAVQGSQYANASGYSVGDYIRTYASMGMFLGNQYQTFPVQQWNYVVTDVGNDPSGWCAFYVNIPGGEYTQVSPSVSVTNHATGVVNGGIENLNISNMLMVIGADYTGTEPSPGVAVWDNIGIYPPNPKISTAIDNFATQNSTLWNYYFATAQCVPSGNQLLMPEWATGSWITSRRCYDLTESSLSVEFVAGLLGDELYKTGNNDAMFCNSQGSFQDKVVTFEVVNGALCARNYWQTVGEQVVIPMTWPLYARIRESHGIFYWDTSPDGITWTNQRTAELGWRPWHVWFTPSECSSYSTGGNSPSANPDLIHANVNIAHTWDVSPPLGGVGELSATATFVAYAGALTGNGQLTATIKTLGFHLAGHGTLTAVISTGPHRLPLQLPFMLGGIYTVQLSGHGALTADRGPHTLPLQLPFMLGGSYTVQLAGAGALAATAAVVPWPAILPWVLPINLPRYIVGIPGVGALTTPLEVMLSDCAVAGHGALFARAYDAKSSSPRIINLPPDNRFVEIGAANRTAVVGPDVRYEDVPKARTP